MATFNNIGMVSINPGYRTSGDNYVRMHKTNKLSETAKKAAEVSRVETGNANSAVGRLHSNPIMQISFGMVIIAAGLLNFIGQLSPLFIL